MRRHPHSITCFAVAAVNAVAKLLCPVVSLPISNRVVNMQVGVSVNCKLLLPGSPSISCCISDSLTPRDLAARPLADSKHSTMSLPSVALLAIRYLLPSGLISKCTATPLVLSHSLL